MYGGIRGGVDGDGGSVDDGDGVGGDDGDGVGGDDGDKSGVAGRGGGGCDEGPHS